MRGGGVGVCIQLLQFHFWTLKESELGFVLNSKGVHKVLGHITYLNVLMYSTGEFSHKFPYSKDVIVSVDFSCIFRNSNLIRRCCSDECWVRDDIVTIARKEIHLLPVANRLMAIQTTERLSQN